MSGIQEGESSQVEVTEIILASTSPYRREQLARLGIAFRCRRPAVDEEVLKTDYLAVHPDDPEGLAQMLARSKAQSLVTEYPDALLIGGDQLAVFGAEILGKPGAIPATRRQLARLSGREHRIITAMAVVAGQRLVEHLDVAHLRMRDLSEQQIVRYVAADEPFDCAGGYKLERGGIALFERIAAEDHSAITGLPLIALTTILTQFGIEIPGPV